MKCKLLPKSALIAKLNNSNLELPVLNCTINRAMCTCGHMEQWLYLWHIRCSIHVNQIDMEMLEIDFLLLETSRSVRFCHLKISLPCIPCCSVNVQYIVHNCAMKYRLYVVGKMYHFQKVLENRNIKGL